MDTNTIREGIQVFSVFVSVGTAIVLTVVNWLTALRIMGKVEERHNAFTRTALYGILMILIAIYFKL